MKLGYLLMERKKLCQPSSGSLLSGLMGDLLLHFQGLENISNSRVLIVIYLFVDT